jgi:hypothetical protein
MHSSSGESSIPSQHSKLEGHMVQITYSFEQMKSAVMCVRQM